MMNSVNLISKTKKIYHPILEYVLHTDIKTLLTKEIQIPDDRLSILYTLIDKAASGIPVPYLTHKAYFFNDSFYVDEAVLIPRPETEFIVEYTIAYISSHTSKNLTIYDVCTGSGCIGLSIAKYVSRNHQIYLTDISPEALEVTRMNAHSLLNNPQNIHIIESDILKHADFTNDRVIDILVSNPPYIASHKIPHLDSSVKNYEPHLALDGGNEGITSMTKILIEARPHMAEKFLMLFEIDEDQGEILIKLASSLYPDAQIQVQKDLFGRDRYIKIEQS